jgi:hypothetical protein
MAEDLTVQIAKRFIARRDVKAIQFDDGAYCPDVRLAEIDAEMQAQGKHSNRLGPYGPVGFKMSHLRDHLAGTKTYGHYLLDHDGTCKLFALDIDLEKEGHWIDFREGEHWQIYQGAPRDEWRDRAHPSRAWYKYQMKALATKFANSLKKLDIPCAIAYTGNKGIHVYGFTGLMQAAEVREVAKIVLDTTGEFAPYRGDNFYKHVSEDPTSGFQNFSVEVFPKQDTLEGKDLGNLMRLPLGRNRKTTDPTFFIYMGGRMTDLRPHPDQARVLEMGDPFRD